MRGSVITTMAVSRSRSPSSSARSSPAATGRPFPVPELMAYLNDYPRGRPAGAEDFLYWSVVDFGLKPTIRVNHVIVYPLPARQSLLRSPPTRPCPHRLEPECHPA